MSGSTNNNVGEGSTVASQPIFTLEEVSATIAAQINTRFRALTNQLEDFSDNLRSEVFAMIKDRPLQAPNDANPPPVAREVTVTTATAGGAFQGSSLEGSQQLPNEPLTSRTTKRSMPSSRASCASECSAPAEDRARSSMPDLLCSGKRLRLRNPAQIAADKWVKASSNPQPLAPPPSVADEEGDANMSEDEISLMGPDAAEDLQALVEGGPAPVTPDGDDDIIGNLRSKLAKEPEAPHIDPVLASTIKELWGRKPLDRGQLRAHLSQVQVPGNTPFFRPQPTNSSIYSNCSENTKATDRLAQGVQAMVGEAAVCLAHQLDILKAIPKEAISPEYRSAFSLVKGKGTDALISLAECNAQMVHKRKERASDAYEPSVRQELRKRDTLDSSELFGDKVSEFVQSVRKEKEVLNTLPRFKVSQPEYTDFRYAPSSKEPPSQERKPRHFPSRGKGRGNFSAKGRGRKTRGRGATPKEQSKQ